MNNYGSTLMNIHSNYRNIFEKISFCKKEQLMGMGIYLNKKYPKTICTGHSFENFPSRIIPKA